MRLEEQIELFLAQNLSVSAGSNGTIEIKTLGSIDSLWAQSGTQVVAFFGFQFNLYYQILGEIQWWNRDVEAVTISGEWQFWLFGIGSQNKELQQAIQAAVAIEFGVERFPLTRSLVFAKAVRGPLNDNKSEIDNELRRNGRRYYAV